MIYPWTLEFVVWQDIPQLTVVHVYARKNGKRYACVSFGVANWDDKVIIDLKYDAAHQALCNLIGYDCERSA